MSLGPFDLTGGPFLQLYAVLFALAILAGFLIPRWFRPEGREVRRVDADHLAYLAGGAPRLAETVTARLLAGRRLVLNAEGRFVPARSHEGSALERSVLALPEGVPWQRVSRAVGGHVDAIRDRLERDGLLIAGGEALRMRFLQTMPYLLLLAFGSTKLLIGMERGRPVGFLVAFLAATAVFALIRWATLDRRTRAGRALLAGERDRSDRLRRAPAAGETDYAVALFGTAVLMGSDWGDFHKLRTAGGDGGSSDSGSSDGGSSGGSGCGGGGCGGCGS